MRQNGDRDQVLRLIQARFGGCGYIKPNERKDRALELLGGSIDPEIEESYASIEARILAQALENVELAERRLREIRKLVGDFEEILD